MQDPTAHTPSGIPGSQTVSLPPVSWAGFGIAGNFAGHLEQAGEVRDFATLVRVGAGPKGMFPFHLPIAGHALCVNPLSSTHLRLPAEGGQVQMEPETALLCALSYGSDGQISVVVHAFAAFDDASIRREGAIKISHKKNWGPSSKGIAPKWIPLPTGVSAGSALDSYRIASFLERDGVWHAYGIDSPVRGYSLYGDPLVAWIANTLSTQKDEGPLEDLPALLRQAECPRYAVVTIGSTRYTEFGERTFVRPGDRTAVAVYDPSQVPTATLPALFDRLEGKAGLSLLLREVVQG